MEDSQMSTKNRILYGATRLFATQNYDAVSMKDIGTFAKIKSASIYYYFDSKENILQAIFKKYREEFISYFDLALETIKKEKSLKLTLDIMFETLWNVHNEFMYYGMVIIMKEQFHNKLAKDLACELFYTFAIERIQYYFDMLAENYIIAPCNSKAIATFMLFSVLVGTQIRIQASIDQTFIMDMDEAYQELYNFIYDVASGKRTIPETR